MILCTAVPSSRTLLPNRKNYMLLLILTAIYTKTAKYVALTRDNRTNAISQFQSPINQSTNQPISELLNCVTWMGITVEEAVSAELCEVALSRSSGEQGSVDARCFDFFQIRDLDPLQKLHTQHLSMVQKTKAHTITNNYIRSVFRLYIILIRVVSRLDQQLLFWC